MNRGAPLRIVLGLETSGPGGAEAMLLQLAAELRDRGLVPILATMRRGWMTERAEREGIPVWVDAMRPGTDPRWIARLYSRLRREHIDVFHAHEFEMNAYGGAAAICARIPNVATIHGSVAGTSPRHMLAYRALTCLGQRTIAVSHDLAASLSPQLRGEANSMRVIHNGIPISAMLSRQEREAKRLRARRELDLPLDGALLVAIGNLYAVKDHATLLRAGSKLSTVRIAIAGRGEEESALRELSNELGMRERLHLLGLRDDVPRVLSAADVFVQPSRSEGLPLAVLEAMAAQVPIVATRVGGVAEAVIDGETGLLVAPGAPDELAEALRRILASPDRSWQITQAAWERARDKFSVSRMTDQYLALYDELLAS